MTGYANEVKDVFAKGVPVIEELLVGLVVSLDLHDFEEHGDTNVEGLVGFQPATVDTVMFDECSETTM